MDTKSNPIDPSSNLMDLLGIELGLRQINGDNQAKMEAGTESIHSGLTGKDVEVNANADRNAKDVTNSKNTSASTNGDKSEYMRAGNGHTNEGSKNAVPTGPTIQKKFAQVTWPVTNFLAPVNAPIEPPQSFLITIELDNVQQWKIYRDHMGLYAVHNAAATHYPAQHIVQLRGVSFFSETFTY
jgi:hypothetical protein